MLTVRFVNAYIANFIERLCIVDLSEKIMILRKEKGYMQTEVAEELGIAPNTLSGYEKGKRKPNSDMVKKMAEFYGVSIDYLLGNDTSIDDLERNFPEGIRAIKRAYKELTPQARKQMLKVMNSFLEK